MKNHALVGAIAALLTLTVPRTIHAAGTTFNVKSYGAVGDGMTDDTKAIQAAVDAAIEAGPGNTVLLPGGVYLIANAPIHIEHSTGLTFTGAGVASTTVWYTLSHPRAFIISNNRNITIENFSADVQKLPSTGKYDLGETQGTIVSVNAAAKQATVRVEDGYPLLTRSDIQKAPSVGWHTAWFWTRSDPKRMDIDYPPGYPPVMTNIDAAPDCQTGTISFQSIAKPLYRGEQWIIYTQLDSLFLNMTYNSGITTVQKIHYYGGAVNWFGAVNYGSGKLHFNQLYCGPPPYQPDRVITCNEGFAMSASSRDALTITNSTFLGTWDDDFDRGCDEAQTKSQPAPNQVVVADCPASDYQTGDTVEFADDTDQPTGAIYATSTLTTAERQPDGEYLLTLNQPVTIKNPGKDVLTDLSQAGPVTAIDCTFNCGDGRHVYFRSGKSVTVKHCTFLDNTPLVIGGWDNSEGPSETRNVTVSGNTFLHSQGVQVACNNGSDTAASGANVIVTGNRFLNCGRLTQNGKPDGPDVWLYSEPLTVTNATGVTVTDNWFDNDWGANAQFRYDADVTVLRNTFVHPNEVHPLWANTVPDDTSVIWFSDCAGLHLARNIVSSAGPFTRILAESTNTVTDATGLTDGTLDIDNPIVLPAAANRRDSSYMALPIPSAPGSCLVTDLHSGKSLGVAPRPNFKIAVAPAITARSGYGAVFLNWTPATGASAYSVERSRSANGIYQTIASGLTTRIYADTSAAPNTPYYYAVRAEGAPLDAGNSRPVYGIAGRVIPVDLSKLFDTVGIDHEGTAFIAGFDGSGHAFSAATLSSPLVGDNAVFTLGPTGAADALFDRSQTIPTPSGSYGSLEILAASIGGGHKLTVTLLYGDGSADTVTRNVNDWNDSRGATDDIQYVAARTAHRLNGDGAGQSSSGSLYGISLPVNPAKTLRALTLSNSGRVGILAMSLTATAAMPVNIAAAYNITAIEPDAWECHDTGMDGHGDTYAAALLSNSQDALSHYAVAAAGEQNCIIDAGQRIILPPGNYTHMMVLGSGTGAFTPRITYSDGSSVNLSQRMTGWTSPASQPGESNAAVTPYCNSADGMKRPGKYYVHAYRIAIDPSRTVAWLDLPSTGNVRILAIDLTTD